MATSAPTGLCDLFDERHRIEALRCESRCEIDAH
jgi:hypothetical protein